MYFPYIVIVLSVLIFPPCFVVLRVLTFIKKWAMHSCNFMSNIWLPGSIKNIFMVYSIKTLNTILWVHESTLSLDQNRIHRTFAVRPVNSNGAKLTIELPTVRLGAYSWHCSIVSSNQSSSCEDFIRIFGRHSSSSSSSCSHSSSLFSLQHRWGHPSSL